VSRRFFSNCRLSLEMLLPSIFSSEITPQGRKTTRLHQTLLNGNNICMVRGQPRLFHCKFLAADVTVAHTREQRSRGIIASRIQGMAMARGARNSLRPTRILYFLSLSAVVVLVVRLRN
jgi:hypothetical protein